MNPMKYAYEMRENIMQRFIFLGKAVGLIASVTGLLFILEGLGL
jgi:hypothetical protein